MAARAPVRAAPAVREQPPGALSLAARASAFEAFMRHARRIEPAFGGPGDVAQALQTGAAHEPHELEAGMITPMPPWPPCREAAASSPLRRADHSATSPATPPPTRRPGARPARGADAPQARASGALYAEGSALSGEGVKIKRASYSVQHQAWATAKVPDAAGRLSRVKRLSSEAYRPAREDAAELQMSLAGAARRSGAPSPVVARGVALAARYLLGETPQGANQMSEPRTTSCLHMAKLNLYQCLASAGPHYEDIYCLGQHAMIDPGQCVVEATQTHSPAPRQVAMTRASYAR